MPKNIAYQCETHGSFDKFYPHCDDEVTATTPCPECDAPAAYYPSAQFAVGQGVSDWWSGKDTSLGHFTSRAQFRGAMERAGHIEMEPGIEKDADNNRAHRKAQTVKTMREKVGQLAQDGLYDRIAYGSKS